MSDEKFSINRLNKFEDWLENECTDFSYDKIKEHFNVETVEELSKEQIMEVVDYSEEVSSSWVSLGLRNCISLWENENEEFVL